MAIIKFVDKRNPRNKRMQHLKLRFRSTIFKASILINLILSIYIAHMHGYLTNIYVKVAPILESLINKLPL